MGGITVREFEPTDYASLKLIHDSLFPDHPMFLDETKYDDSCFGRTRYRMLRFVAETDSGRVVGYGEYKHLFFAYHPQRFAMGVEVHPEWQQRGIGRVLYQRVLKELAIVRAQTALPLVLSTSGAGIRFLRNRGFVEKRKMIGSRLDLEEFDPTKFTGLVERLRDEGISVVSLSSEMLKDPSAGRKLKDLEESGAADVPGEVSDSPMDFHDYQIVILDNPNIVWEFSFVAKDGDKYVGSSTILRSGVEGLLDEGFTVVRPEYRGRGIAQAVKFHVASRAKNEGVKYSKAGCDSENTAMLAVNKKIGFVRQAEEWLTFEKNLSAAEESLRR